MFNIAPIIIAGIVYCHAEPKTESLWILRSHDTSVTLVAPSEDIELV